MLVDSGLRDAGYNYVVLDDCWSIGRGDDGYIRFDEQRFPNGMRYLSDRIHQMGLLFGIYSSAGEMTCARYGKTYRERLYNLSPVGSVDMVLSEISRLAGL